MSAIRQGGLSLIELMKLDEGFLQALTKKKKTLNARVEKTHFCGDKKDWGKDLIERPRPWKGETGI